MFFAVQLTSNWLVSSKARFIYIVSACLTVYLAGILLTIAFAVLVRNGTLAHSPVVVLLLEVLLLPGIIGTAVLWVGMWYFWFCCHPKESTSKVPWFALMYLSGPIGSLLYFLIVYLRSPLAAKPEMNVTATATLNP